MNRILYSHEDDKEYFEIDKVISEKILSTSFTFKFDSKFSYWRVFATDKISGKKEEILKATMNEIWGKELNQERYLRSISKKYGRDIIKKIKNEGFCHTYFLMKGKMFTKRKLNKMKKEKLINLPETRNRLASIE